MNKKGLLGTIITILVLIVIGFFWFVREMNSEEEITCVKVQTTCCGCNMGGSEKCVLGDEVEKYEKNLSECSPTIICGAVFNCEIESCEYIKGECIPK
ncbi:MAG: hypothetical protein NUV97_03000 [archaeon]|nr:hypothetical protein [archaeon]MCR4324039.1 hypothetical protein [Nanoarchaeota archaeon]